MDPDTFLSSPEIKEFPLFSRGKVRDVYDLGDHLLMVASDRISAFDVILPTLIPGKGKILTQISRFWFEKLGVANHLIGTDISDLPKSLHKYQSYLKNRFMVVKKAKRFDVECVVRGYLAGSGFKDYQKSGMVCGNVLPKGLQKSSKIDPPVYTPATKADSGHDENINFAESEKILGPQTAQTLKTLSLEIYQQGRKYALEKGIIIADTKFEFGEIDGQITLIDEVLTPDSSRFWPEKEYSEGNEQPSFDKQIIRNYLEGLDWDKTYPGPALPQPVVQKSLDRYVEVFHLITGQQIEL